MAQEDYRFEQLKYRFLEADFQFRAGRLTDRDFNDVVVDILIILLDMYGKVYPYYQQMQELAESKWKKAKRNPKMKEKIVEPNPLVNANLRQGLKELSTKFLHDDFLYRCGKVSLFEHNLFLSGFFVHLLNAIGSIQPHLKELEDLAEKQWKESSEYKDKLLSDLSW